MKALATSEGGSAPPHAKRLLCHSHPPRCGPNSPYPQTYTHWIPEELNPTDSDQTALGHTTPNMYTQFNKLVHATHLQDAVRIVQDGAILCRPITDSTVANCNLPLLPDSSIPEDYDCLRGAQAVWVAPDCALSKRFGPIAFNLSITGSEGILRQFGRRPNDFNYYWIEVIDYFRSQAASRILVVERSKAARYASLEPLRYDPTVRGGPWYWDTANDVHYALTESKAYDGSRREHTLEFVRLKDFSWARDIVSWFATPHDGCKRYKEKCWETTDRLGFAKASLSMWAHTSEIKSKRRWSEDDDDHVLSYFLGELHAKPRNEDNDESENELNWGIVLSCLKDRNFEGAFSAARQIPHGFLRNRMSRDFSWPDDFTESPKSGSSYMTEET